MTTEQTTEIPAEFYAAALKLEKALRDTLPACPIYGDHRLHHYWLNVSDRGFEALEAFRKANLGSDSRG